MSQSSYQSTIEDLPDVNSSTNNTIFKEVFCFGLFINIAASGPCRLFVTDFTTNSLISNSYHDSYFVDEFEIPTEQIFQIDIYKEKLKTLIDEYEDNFGESLFDAGLSPPFRISNKICILKASVVLKKFNNVLEGRARSVRLANEGDLASENLHKLYSSLEKLPKTFFVENIERAKKVIPNVYYNQFFASTNTNSNAKTALKSNTESVIHDSQPRQTYVKTEETTDTMIPDTLFPEDYNHTTEQMSTYNELQQANPIESQNESQYRYPNYENNGTDSHQYYSLKQLNNNYSLELDNEVYRVKGRIVGCNPSDWSYVCVKTYEIKSKLNYVSLSDPSMRDLELIISDVELNNLEEVLLDSNNSISVFLDKDQIVQALNIEAIEAAYTKIAGLNEKSFTDNVLDFELYKKLITINAKNQFLVWSVRNITFNLIMD